MAIIFQPGQPVTIHLPGGDYRGTIVGPAQYPNEWVLSVEEADNPIEEVLKGAEE